MATLSLVFVAGISQQPAAQAGPESAPVAPESLLPQNVGIAVDTRSGITIPFKVPMDPASVEAALQVLPEHSTTVSWNADQTALTIAPERLWRTDEQYLVVVGSTAATAEGRRIAAAQRYAFTTATAPAVTDFQVRLAPSDVAEATAESRPAASPSATLDADTDPLIGRAVDPEQPDDGSVSQPPTETATEVSASSSISVDFSAPMDQADVEARFTIAPAVEGDLSWSGRLLVFTPTERLHPGTRYTISVIGAHDRHGNPVGGEANFSFIVQPGAEVTKVDPARDATDVEPTKLSIWFSQPMDRKATGKALRVTDANGAAVAGKLSWNEASTQASFKPTAPLAAGMTYKVSLGKGGRDIDGNLVKSTWSFTTKAAAVPVAAPPTAAPPPAPARTQVTTRSAPSIPPPAPATSLAGYALNQVNAARAAYGFGPLVLDSAISAVASAHAMDQAVNNYFSHYGLDGSSRETRLRRGGVSFGYSGENQCYHVGMSQQATLDWCHAQFMAEPYPGQWNHIANILDPRFKRMGVGIATVGGKTVITWDFTN